MVHGHNSDWLILETRIFSLATVPLLRTSDKFKVLWSSVFERKRKQILELRLVGVCDQFHVSLYLYHMELV